MSDQPDSARRPLFVFGTLRRGHRNHHCLEGRYERVIPATLNGYCRLHELMIAPAAGGQVDGELFFLIRGGYEMTMAGCDDLEEIPPGQLIGHEYQRKQVTVQTSEGPFDAWAYVQPETDPVSHSAMK